MNNIVNISVITNLTIKHYFDQYIETYFGINRFDTNITYINLHQLDDDYYLNVQKSSDVVFMFLNYELLFNKLPSDIRMDKEIYNNIISFLDYVYTKVKENSQGLLICMGYEDYYDKYDEVIGSVINKYRIVDKINIYLDEKYSDNFVLIDLKRLISKVGINNAFDIKSKYRWEATYNKVLIDLIAKEVNKQFLIYKGISKKCIVLDCDNVLWGGIIEQDGVNNIKIGEIGSQKVFADFQRYLLSLNNLGIILSISSKNDFEDIIHIFKHHDGMILREDNIACFMVNWDNKAENIVKISEKLNIGLDSMIFIDDSNFEIQCINELLPEVKTVLFDKNLNFFDKMEVNISLDVNLIDAKIRNNTYRSNILRDELKKNTINYESFLKKLDTKIVIRQACSSDYERISSLSQRTNKCTNGQRYTISELCEKIDDCNYTVYCVNASDLYGDLGLVGVIGLEQKEDETILDLFCLSCRVLGRNVEKFMIDYILAKNELNNFIFYITKKNHQLYQLLSSLIKHTNKKEGILSDYNINSNK